MKIEPVLNSQISLLKRRNLSFEKLAKENPMYAEKIGIDKEIRDNCEKIADLVTLIEYARKLDAETADDADFEDSVTEELPSLGSLPPLLGG